MDFLFWFLFLFQLRLNQELSQKQITVCTKLHFLWIDSNRCPELLPSAPGRRAPWIIVIFATFPSVFFRLDSPSPEQRGIPRGTDRYRCLRAGFDRVPAAVECGHIVSEMYTEFQSWCLRTYGDSGKTKTVTRPKYNRILQTLQGEETNHGLLQKNGSHINAKFKFWVKSKGFQVGTGSEGTEGPVLYVPVRTTVSSSIVPL
uniref:LAGLIDADG homing endonuclease n=1 Tax=Knipowitschia caucasica TaxID=637954 RepID=A0AAV2JD00_KNICA